MAKRASKDMIRKIKEKEDLERKSNYTFRITDSVLEKFRHKCEANGVSMTSVIEELILNFLEE